MITSRDRKIILLLIPLLLVAGYWFLILAPKRAESQTVTQELTKAQSARDTAEQKVTQLNAAKASFASDYAAVVRLGKAVPTTLDMPSLLVQLDRAARGTGIEVDDFKPGTADGSATAPTSAPQNTPPGGGNNPASSSTPAQGFPAQQAQHAGQAVTSANNQEQANANAANGAGSSPGAPSSSSVGLTSVPLTFTVTGRYFGLANFFHRLKRFVRVINDQIVVRGRLMTVESFQFAKIDPQSDVIKADVTATIYLTPADQGPTAGASSSGPASSTSAGTAQPAPSTSTPATSTPSTPTATATP